MYSFPMITVPEDASEVPEQMGSKAKFWYSRDGILTLYKIARSGTGEDWSEKAAEQLAGLLGLPHATYELATWHNSSNNVDTQGVITPTLVPNNARLISGNEMLKAEVQGYPSAESASGYRRVSQHTVGNVLSLITQAQAILPPNWEPPFGIVQPAELFVGYLLLDAWIGNTDRHHENWAFIEVAEEAEVGAAICAPQRFLAPTFDHASCLGRNETDARRESRLRPSDTRASVAAYAAKARSALYETEAATKPLTVHTALNQVTLAYPKAARVWRQRLTDVSEEDVAAVFARIPASRISPVAAEFALALLRENKRLLLNGQG